MSQQSYLDGTSVGYWPDALGEATQVSGYASGVSYQPDGSVASYTLANGIVHSQSQNTRGLPLVNADSGVLQDQYSYDADGNVTAIADQQQGATSRSMAYDGLDRLTAANAPNVWGSASFSYDALDNLRTSVVGARSSTHTYDANNRLSLLNTNGAYTGYAYDAQGNITARGSSGYYFDQGNRLKLANGVASYEYDGLGRRTGLYKTNGVSQAQVYGPDGLLLWGAYQPGAGAAVSTTRYIYLAGHEIAETDSTTGVTTFAHTDALGSPVAKTNAAGAIVSRTRYEAYGNTAAGTVPTTLGFTGHVNDPDTGLVYMQQRYYDPVAGRFQSVDPVVTDADTGAAFDRYVYANNNPYRYTDPDGRAADSTGHIGLNWQVVSGSNSGSSAATGSNAAKGPSGAAGSAGAAPEGPAELMTPKETDRMLDRAILGATILGMFVPGVGELEAGVLAGMRTAEEAALAAKEAQTASKVFSAEKQALVEMAKADRKAGMTAADMQSYKDLNTKLADPFPSNKVRGPEAHNFGAPSSREPHGHVGPVDHIPIRDPLP